MLLSFASRLPQSFLGLHIGCGLILFNLTFRPYGDGDTPARVADRNDAIRERRTFTSPSGARPYASLTAMPVTRVAQAP